MRVNRAGLRRVERGIRPPMAKAITIPVGPPGGAVTVYVSTSAFALDDRTTDAELTQLATAVAGFLEGFDAPAPKAKRASPRPHARAARVRRTATGWTFVGSVESDSEPGVEHQIKRRDAGGTLGCDCMAYRFKKGEKTCKHLDAYRATQAGSVTSARGPVVATFTTPTETFTVRRGISFDALK